MSTFVSILDALRRELRPTLRLAVPIVIAELGWMSMGTVDTIMVGRLPNPAVALGAVALGNVLYYTVAIFGGGLLLGLDTMVSQAFGRNDMHDARHSLVNAVGLAVVLTPPLMGVVLLMPRLMRLIGVDPTVINAMWPFLRAMNWGTPALMLYFGLRRYLQAVHIVAPVTFALISANIVNALFDWVFIFGHLGSPAYGVAGSGWSTSLARLYMMLVLVAALLYHDRPRDLRLRAPGMRFERTRMRQLLGLGAPAASQILLEIGAFGAAAALAGKLGPVPIAAHQIAINCAATSYMVPLGISSAAAVRVGNAIGRHDPAGARRAGWMSIVLGAGFMTCAGIVFVAMPRLLARVFTPDPVVIAAGATLLLIAAAFQLFDGVQTVSTGALRGAGDTRTPMIANFIAYWIIGLPVGWVLCFRLGWGVAGLWIGLTIGLVIVASWLLGTWWRRSSAADSLQQSAFSTQL